MYNYYVDKGPHNGWAVAQQVEDRVLHVGWAPVAPLSALTCLRELRYDHRVDRLVATPVDELASLRNGTLYHAEEQRVDERAAREYLDGRGRQWPAEMHANSDARGGRAAACGMSYTPR